MVNEHKIAIGLVFIVFIALANLRGVRESGALFATPTYIFVVSFLLMIGFGLFHYFMYGGAAPAPTEDELKTAEGYSLQPLTMFLCSGPFPTVVRPLLVSKEFRMASRLSKSPKLGTQLKRWFGWRYF